MALLGGVGDALNSALGTVISGGNTVLDALTNKTNQQRSFEQDGFIVPPIPGASGEGLPSSKVISPRKGVPKRHIIHWFVPEVGVINMYINPQSINYAFKKLITPERTKGGYVIQYWGEELTTLNLQGHTGSSGVEGLNVLYEIYRAEQLNFDPIALTMASDQAVSGLGNLLGDASSSLLGGIGGGIAGAVGGVLGLNPLTQSILPRNPPTLASLAFSVEMYYAGWVMRGYFTDMTVNESVDKMGLFTYDIKFTVTQRRGYRLNIFDFQHAANFGPSHNGSGDTGSTIPLSYGRGTSFVK